MRLKEGKNREIRNICIYYKWNINQLIRLSYDRFTLHSTSHLTTGNVTGIDNLQPLKSGGLPVTDVNNSDNKKRVIYTINSGEIIEIDQNIVNEILIQVNKYIMSNKHQDNSISNSNNNTPHIHTTSTNNTTSIQQLPHEVKPGSLLTKPDNAPNTYGRRDSNNSATIDNDNNYKNKNKAGSTSAVKRWTR